MLTYPHIDPILLSIGPFAIRWYSLAYLAGIILPFILFRRTMKHTLALSYDHMVDWATYVACGIILGGRIGYVLFYDTLTFIHKPWLLFFVWNGGMSYHGGILGAALGTYLFARHKKKSLWACFDTICLASTIGIGLGRVANFINGELYGRVTTSPLGMIFPNGGPLPRHPSQLYEACVEGLLLFLILWAIRKYLSPAPGYLSAIYLIGYGTGRFILEFFREPDAHIGFIISHISLGQILCIIECICGLGIILYLKKINPKNNFQNNS